MSNNNNEPERLALSQAAQVSLTFYLYGIFFHSYLGETFRPPKSQPFDESCLQALAEKLRDTSSDS
jgi:hypothetical protein